MAALAVLIKAIAVLLQVLGIGYFAFRLEREITARLPAIPDPDAPTPEPTKGVIPGIPGTIPTELLVAGGALIILMILRR